MLDAVFFAAGGADAIRGNEVGCRTCRFCVCGFRVNFIATVGGANCRTQAVDEESLTIDNVCHRRTPPPRGTDVPPSILLFASPGKCESDKGIANRVITRMPATQAVTIRGDTAVGDISTERVDNKLASIREVGYGARRRPTGVGNVGGGIERKQHLASLGVSRIKFPVPLTEEHQIAGNEHTGLRGLRQANLPNNSTGAGVGGSVQAKGPCARNMIDEGRAQVKVSVDRLGDKTRIAGVSLEDIRVVPGAVVHEFCPRAKSCGVPFASPVVARHNEPQRFIRRSVLG